MVKHPRATCGRLLRIRNKMRCVGFSKIVPSMAAVPSSNRDVNTLVAACLRLSPAVS